MNKFLSHTSLVLLSTLVICGGCSVDTLEPIAPAVPADSTNPNDTTHWRDACWDTIVPYGPDSMLVVEFSPFGDTLAVDTVPKISGAELTELLDSVALRIARDIDTVMCLDIEQEKFKLRLIDSLKQGGQND